MLIRDYRMWKNNNKNLSKNVLAWFATICHVKQAIGKVWTFITKLVTKSLIFIDAGGGVVFAGLCPTCLSQPGAPPRLPQVGDNFNWDFMLLRSKWQKIKFFLAVQLKYFLIFSPAHSSVAAVVNYRKVGFGGVNHNQLNSPNKNNA